VATRISALVVTWNSAARLEGLLDSLADDAAETELVHVDNGSDDNSLAIASRWSGPLRQIANEHNLGYATGLKQAFDASVGEFALVVNADVRLQPGALATLTQRLETELELGAVGPKLLDEDGAVQLTSARRLPTLRSTVVHEFGLRRLVEGTRFDPYTFTRATYEVERDVPAISGAVMLIRRSALAAAGGIDARWFMYFEDLDICARLGAEGWRIRYCPAAVGAHEGAASSPRTPELETWLAVHLEAAVNLFLLVHRGRTVALAHRAAAAASGILRTVASVALVPRSRTSAAAAARRGIALLRWAILDQMPGGGPKS
jgi:N-acetylglucosaminyl-diphospho-decaprenol L-rhamnosyltransferase